VREFSDSRRSNALYQGPTLQAAEILGFFEGDGLQAVHNCCVMNSASAAEDCSLPKSDIFPSLFSRAIDAQQR
jgi:hypothetical protein